VSLFKAIKFQLNKTLIKLRLKKERYKWYPISNSLNFGKAVFLHTNKKKLRYREYIEKAKEEEELNKLIITINKFLDIKENSDTYKSFVAREYKKMGYTVWEYSKDNKKNNQFDLLLKKKKDIILVKCKDDNINIGIRDIYQFIEETQEFIQKNEIFNQYNIKLRYTMSSLLLKEDAYEYIQDNPKKMDYNIIKKFSSFPFKE
jgi:hypothetical protein